MPVYRLPVTTVDPRAGTCVNVWHIRTVAADQTGVTPLQGAVDAIRAFYASRIADFPSGNKITADFAVEMTDQTDAAVTWAPITATGAGFAAPPHLAVSIGWKTGTRARRARGRTFFGPTIVNNIDSDGTLNNTFKTNLETSCTTLVNASKLDNGWSIGVWGLVDPAPKGQTTGLNLLPHEHRDITGFAISDKWAVMRSRRP